MYLAADHKQQNNIALRWSARFVESPSYKHVAPTGQHKRLPLYFEVETLCLIWSSYFLKH
jgi:hypothetical protein